MHERTIFSHGSLESLNTCCEKHADIPPADHAIAAVSFTVDEHECDENEMVPTQKFAVMVLADGESFKRGVRLTPHITMLILDTFAELVSETAGPRLMAAAMVQAVIRKYGAEVLEDATEVEAVKGTPSNPIVGGRRRTDYTN